MYLLEKHFSHPSSQISLGKWYETRNDIKLIYTLLVAVDHDGHHQQVDDDDDQNDDGDEKSFVGPDIELLVIFEI